MTKLDGLGGDILLEIFPAPAAGIGAMSPPFIQQLGERDLRWRPVPDYGDIMDNSRRLNVGVGMLFDSPFF